MNPLTPVALAIAALAWTACIGAEESAGGETPRGPEAKAYAASIDVPVRAVTYFDPIFVSARITPLRNTDFQSVRVIPQGYLARMYPTIDTEGDSNGFECHLGSPQRFAGRPFVASCEITVKKGLFDQLLDPLLFVEPGAQKVLLEIAINEAGTPVTYFEEATVQIAPPKILVVYGGFFGALLLALFSAMKDRIAAPLPNLGGNADVMALIRSQTLPWIMSFGLRLWKTLLLAFVGGVCALILILLAQVTEGVKPPITIKVQDFWGGVVLGLFSVPLSKWISDRLRSM